MVNNAGISQVKPLADVTQEEVERIYRINVQGIGQHGRYALAQCRNAARTPGEEHCIHLLDTHACTAESRSELPVCMMRWAIRPAKSFWKKLRLCLST